MARAPPADAMQRERADRSRIAEAYAEVVAFQVENAFPRVARNAFRAHAGGHEHAYIEPPDAA